MRPPALVGWRPSLVLGLALLVRAICYGLILLLLGQASVAMAAVMELKQAHVVTRVAGTISEKQVDLPYNWDRENQFLPGRGTFTLHFHSNTRAEEPYAFYFPSVGNAVAIRLNGNLLAQYGNLDAGGEVDFSKSPLILSIPAEVLKPENILTVEIAADGGRRGGLSAILVGPDRELRPLFRANFRVKVWSALMIAALNAMVGLLALFLWLNHRSMDPEKAPQREGLYLWAAVASLFWTVRLSDVALYVPPLAWPGWGVLQIVAYAGWIYGVALFCHYKAKWHLHPSMRWIRAVVWAMVLSSAPLAYYALNHSQPIYLTAWLGITNLLFVIYGFFYLLAALRYPNKERTMVAVAGVVNVAAGARDWLVFRASASFGESPWINYSSLLFGVALLYIVVSRLVNSSNQARDLLLNLEQRVEEKEAALRDSYQQLDQLGRDQERMAERSRILRDMHDGVGAHISMAIHQLQAGPISKELLLLTLRDSMDQLKLSIDSLSLVPGDITAMLANLRYRLAARFAESHIELKWVLENIPPLESMNDQAMRNLQYLVFEALSNVLQHAQASTIKVGLRTLEDGGIQLEIIDNGRGFDPGHVEKGQGLISMRQRAERIGAQLLIHSVPGRTEVSIQL